MRITGQISGVSIQTEQKAVDRKGADTMPKLRKSRLFWIGTKQAARINPWLFTCYWVLRLMVVGILIVQIVNGDYGNAFICILTLVLFLIPTFVEKRIKVDVPDTLEVIVLLFIFSAQILGEISEFYLNVPGWDTMLHTVNGFLCAAVGIAMIDILNRNDRFSISMSPAFVALLAFCFSMTIGVLWEFLEYGADMLFRADMQKDTLVSSVSSVYINPEGINVPVVISDIWNTVISGRVNGQPAEIVMNGYLDIGIIDTMKDLFVNFFGAVVFSVIGYIYIKNRGESKNSRFVRRFILTKITAAETRSPRANTEIVSKSNKKPDRDS